MQNYLFEGVSGTGKATLGEDIQRRGFYVLHGDRELNYFRDPQTGQTILIFFARDGAVKSCKAAKCDGQNNQRYGSCPDRMAGLPVSKN